MMNYRYKLLCHYRNCGEERTIVWESYRAKVKLYQTDTKRRKYPLNESFLETRRENMQRGTEKLLDILK